VRVLSVAVKIHFISTGGENQDENFGFDGIPYKITIFASVNMASVTAFVVSIKQ
jgi:hypothetical protein